MEYANENMCSKKNGSIYISKHLNVLDRPSSYFAGRLICSFECYSTNSITKITLHK